MAHVPPLRRRESSSAAVTSKSFFDPASTFLAREMRFSMGSVTAHERVGHFVHGKAAQYVEHERDLRLLGQSGMATGEYHP